MFDTAIINYAIILGGLGLAGRTLLRMTPITRQNLRRLALSLVAVAFASAGAYAQSAATAAGGAAILGPSRIYVSDWKGNRVRIFDPNPSPTPGTPYVG